MYSTSKIHERREENRVLTVTGVGKISVQPDMAIIQLGFVNQDEELTTAQQTNARTIQRIIESLLLLDLPKENIQTVDYYIYPEYDYVDGKQVFRGYQVTHMLSVKITDIEAAGRIIDTAVRNGVNRVVNIRFTVEDPKVYEQQAIQEALNRALGKAQTIAGTMNFQLDPTPIRIDEKSVGAVEDTQLLTEPKVLSSSTTTIEPGQLDATALIEVEFQYYP